MRAEASNRNLDEVMTELGRRAAEIRDELFDPIEPIGPAPYPPDRDATSGRERPGAQAPGRPRDRGAPPSDT